VVRQGGQPRGGLHAPASTGGVGVSQLLLGSEMVVPRPCTPQAPSHGVGGLGQALCPNARGTWLPLLPRGAFGCPGGETEAGGGLHGGWVLSVPQRAGGQWDHPALPCGWGPPAYLMACPPGTHCASARRGEGPCSAAGAAAPGLGRGARLGRGPRQGTAWPRRWEQPVLLP